MWCQWILTPLLDTFPVWVHICSRCVDADSPTRLVAGITSSAVVVLLVVWFVIS